MVRLLIATVFMVTACRPGPRQGTLLAAATVPDGVVFTNFELVALQTGQVSRVRSGEPLEINGSLADTEAVKAAVIPVLAQNNVERVLVYARLRHRIQLRSVGLTGISPIHEVPALDALTYLNTATFAPVQQGPIAVFFDAGGPSIDHLIQGGQQILPCVAPCQLSLRAGQFTIVRRDGISHRFDLGLNSRVVLRKSRNGWAKYVGAGLLTVGASSALVGLGFGLLAKALCNVDVPGGGPDTPRDDCGKTYLGATLFLGGLGVALVGGLAMRVVYQPNSATVVPTMNGSF